MSSPVTAGIMTTNISQSDQIQLVVDTKDRSVSLVFNPSLGTYLIETLKLRVYCQYSRPLWSCELLSNLIMDVLQKLEEPDSSASAVPAATGTEVPRNDNPDTVRSLPHHVLSDDVSRL
jgi:hypothetical protein